MSVSEKTQITADNVLCKLADTASHEIEWDIAADSQPWPADGAHSTNKFTSQQIKAQGIVLDGTYENVTLTVTFLRSEADQVESWWKAGTKLTYTVTNGTDVKSYTDCYVRISEQPTISPGKIDYVTMQLEISVLMKVNESTTPAASQDSQTQD